MERKVAIVTGGSRGIGAATAKCLGQDGWAVAVNYVNSEQAAQEIAAAVVAAGGEAIAVQADTASEPDVERMFSEVETKWGRLDALVNNAGIVGPRGKLEALTVDAVERVLAVNVTGYILCARAVNSLTIGLSQEVAGVGIRVNAVAPGLTRTDMPNPTVLETAGPSIPIGRIGEAEEIAEGIVWLMSDKASYVAGANLRIAGGRP